MLLEKQLLTSLGVTRTRADKLDFSALCSRPRFMRPPSEIPMKVLMIKGFLATGSRTSKSCVNILEPAGTRFASVPVMPGRTG
jgi:hypothetical protein